MTTVLDTSVLVRYFIGMPPDVAASAARLIEGDEPLLVTEVVLAETGYVLGSFYSLARDEIVDALVGLLGRPNIDTHVLDKTLAIEALLLCRPSRRVSFADALTWAVARSVDQGTIATPDARFPSEGIELRIPD